MANGKDQEQAIEYTILTLAHTGEQSDAQWEKIEVLTDMDKALAQAQKLLATGKYSKVEVKKKFFDEKNNRKIDMTLRMLEAGKKKPLGTWVFVVGALLCGVGAFALTYFLAQ